MTGKGRKAICRQSAEEKPQTPESLDSPQPGVRDAGIQTDGALGPREASVQGPCQTFTGDIRIFLGKATVGPTEHVRRTQDSEDGRSRTQTVRGRWSTEMTD